MTHAEEAGAGDPDVGDHRSGRLMARRTEGALTIFSAYVALELLFASASIPLVKSARSFAFSAAGPAEPASGRAAERSDALMDRSGEGRDQLWSANLIVVWRQPARAEGSVYFPGSG